MDARTAALREALVPLGVELLEPLGPLTWRARDVEGPVRVTAVRPRSRVRATAASARADHLVGVRHRCLAEVLGAARVTDHVVVAHREVHGTDLATVLRGRPRWAPGEVRGVVADVADALAALHAAGLVHGDVAPANVVVDPDGRPVLVDLLGGADPDELGTPGWAAPERADGATAATDAWSVGAIGLELLGRCDRTAAGLRAELERATASDPSARPSAADLAARIRADGPVEPVRPVDSSLLVGALLQERAAREVDEARTVRRPRPARGRHRRRGPARGVVLPLTLLCLVVAASVAGLGLARDGSATTTPSITGTPASGVQLVMSGERDGRAAEAAARRLTLRRAAALAAGDLPSLLSVTEPGSAAAAADRALWRPDGTAATDVEVAYARTASVEDDEWRVAVGVRSGDASQDVVLRLVHDGARWAVRAVEPG